MQRFNNASFCFVDMSDDLGEDGVLDLVYGKFRTLFRVVCMRQVAVDPRCW